MLVVVHSAPGVVNFMRCPWKRSRSAAFVSLRSSPGEETSSTYDPPGAASSTSTIVPNSRLNFEQSSCVPPRDGPPLAPLRAIRSFPGRSINTRSMRCLPAPHTSTSTIPVRSKPPTVREVPDLIQSRPCFQQFDARTAAPIHSSLSSQTKKWAFAHWCASTVLTLRHNSIHCQLYAANMENTNQGPPSHVCAKTPP